jgi:hypothetical protein
LNTPDASPALSDVALPSLASSSDSGAGDQAEATGATVSRLGVPLDGRGKAFA